MSTLFSPRYSIQGGRTTGVVPAAAHPRSGRGRRGRAGRFLRALAAAGIVLALLGLVASAAVYVVLGGLTNPVHFDSLAEVVPGIRVNILVLGLDAPIYNGRAVPEFDVRKATGSRTDTMMLVTVDRENKEVCILSLPRDTRTIIAGREEYGYDKLGHAHAYGGPDMIVATLSRLLDIPIHYYVRVNSAGVAKIIDLLGGVEIYVERDMHYNDPYQDLHIDLKKGLQVLDGDKAVQYLRYRSGSDIERIERQQKFLLALKDQLFQLGTISKIPSLVDEVVTCVDTNMTPSEMLSFAKLALKMGDATVRTGTLPGENALIEDPGCPPLWYWALDEDACAAIVDEFVFGVDPTANAEITVEVQNGTNVNGLAARFAAELERQGYNVVAVTDAERKDHKVTQVVDRSRSKDKLRRLSRAVLRYLPGAEVGGARPIEGKPDFTIILGEDYAAEASSSASLGRSVGWR